MLSIFTRGWVNGVWSPEAAERYARSLVTTQKRRAPAGSEPVPRAAAAQRQRAVRDDAAADMNSMFDPLDLDIDM